ncbi:MAG: type IX secretion system membrane protein PorP/SprF [Bacteroidales bacterium]|nr:type IX secretion system membrane protein PorP/SprF [Bacteroidales bacterium]
MKKLVLIIIVLTVALSSIRAQQMGSFSQTVENKYLVNPGYVGSDESMPIFLGYKRLWTGIDNAPSSQFLTFHMKISEDLGGVGAKIFNYSTGSISKSGLNLSYAYHLKLNDEMKIGFGLSGSLYQFYLDRGQLENVEDANDQVLLNGSEKLIVPDANFGIYFYAKNYYAGISSFQLFGRRVSLMNDMFDNRQVRHYYLHGGYIFELGSDFKLEPSLLLKYIEANKGQWDLNVKTTYKDFVWLGLGYRSDFAFDPNDIIISVGVQKDKIKFGYAYDITLSDIGNVSQGSHELIFIYQFGNTNKSAYKW